MSHKHLSIAGGCFFCLLLFALLREFKLFINPLFVEKVEQNHRKAKFVGSPLVVGKTDAFALLLREKVSVSSPSACASPLIPKLSQCGIG